VIDMSEKQSLATGSALTPETFTDFMERLKYHCNGAGVNDHCTADAIFIVQRKRIVSGIDLDYAPQKLVYCEDRQWFSPQAYWDDLTRAEKIKLNKSCVDEFGSKFLKTTEYEQWEILADIEDHTVTGWDESWEYVSAHFTKEAAEAFIARKKHDYSDGIRIYVEAQTYSWEFNVIKNALIDGKLVLAGDDL
jgi:hypothetical protein